MLKLPGSVAGGAEAVWDAVGGLGVVPGFGLSLGYRWHRVGLEGGFDIAAANPSDRDGLGGGVNLMAVLRMAPEHRFDPTIAVGYVREGILADFNQGEFPLGTVTTDPEGRPVDAGPAGTFGNGVRVDIGGGVGFHPRWYLTVNAMADFVWFGTASYNDFDYSLRESGMSFWPRLAFGVRWDP